MQVRGVAPGRYLVDEGYKGPDGRTHVTTRDPEGDEVSDAAAAGTIIYTDVAGSDSTA